jgi:hypothetical protein
MVLRRARETAARANVMFGVRAGVSFAPVLD